MKSIPELKTDNLIISVLSPENCELLMEYENENREFLSQWEPERVGDYFSLDSARQRLENSFQNFQLGVSLPLVAFNKEHNKIICLCTFSNIVYGPFQACNIGYSICEKEQGKGLMFEMLQASIKYVFDEYELHRIMANYIPSNTRSERLLIKLGFQKEGLAKSYLKIAGSWQDHILTSKVNMSESSIKTIISRTK